MSPKGSKGKKPADIGLDPGKTETSEPPEVQAKVGRPTDYSENLVDRICELIATTPRGLDFIIATNPDLPCSRSVYRWLDEHLAFSQKYKRAREQQADLLFDECLEIADDSSHDTKIVGREGQEIEVADTEWIGRSKLRVDTRLKMAARLSPRKYSEKLDITSGGERINTQVILPHAAGE